MNRMLTAATSKFAYRTYKKSQKNDNVEMTINDCVVIRFNGDFSTPNVLWFPHLVSQEIQCTSKNIDLLFINICNI